MDAREAPSTARLARTARRRYLLAMGSLCLLDVGMTGLYVLIAEPAAVVLGVLGLSALVLGVVNVVVAAWLFAPIGRALAAGPVGTAAAAHIESLPRRSALWAAALSFAYCAAVFGSGTFTPHLEALGRVPLEVRAAGLFWYSAVYACYFGFYVHFLVLDYASRLREAVFVRDGVVVPPRGGRLGRKLAVVFLILAAVPALHLLLDLTWLRPIREAQGLTVEETVLLDLTAIALVVGVATFFVARVLLRPVSALLAGMEQVAAGALDTRLPVVADDEIGRLTERFNRMVDDLRERAFIRETFGKYVPPSVAEAIVRRAAPLEPEVRTATILFADLADFTAIAERLEPERVMRMLNEYFSAVIEPIQAAGGVVNQFQGDAVLATFNVPVEAPDHADAAVRAALAMRETVRRSRFAGVRLRTRIGINTGPVVAGNVGSKDRCSYTVNGDAVNLAARLEQMNKALGSDLLVSQSVVDACRTGLRFVAVGALEVRGKSERVMVYRVEAPRTSDG
ncbi:MAG: adenylate/guanylate cyclase domain-containing protein [Ectothiorhodospiraceae bacterium]|nr:adenylate/guanylate cyclase domain-containing protein [Ectothiorhodospiraceae bacterium]